MDKIQQITEATVKRYSDRFNKLGDNIRTLGWGSVEQQLYRFSQTVFTDFSTKSILDIGCGFCDYYAFLKENQAIPQKYNGWDINENLLGIAATRYKEDDRVSVRKENIAEHHDGQPIADIGVMLGVLNFNLKNVISNYDYSKLLVSHAFQLVNEVLIVDFLSTYKTSEYPEEDFVFYHDPKIMFDFALSLSPNVVLKHNYAPIPQKEFMLFIFKQ